MGFRTSSQPLGTRRPGPVAPEKLAFPLWVGGGGYAPPLPGGGEKGGAQRGVPREGAPARPVRPPRKWIWPLRIQPRFQVFSRPGPACSRLSPAPPPPAPSPECRPLGQVCRASPRTPASQSAAELRRAQRRGRGRRERSLVEPGERTSAGQPEPRAASARRRPHAPRPPRRLPPSLPSPRPCPAGRPARLIRCPRGAPRSPARPQLPGAAQRLHALLFLLSRPGAWHRGPLPDARGPAPLFAARLLLLLLSSNSYSNSLALSTREPSTARPSARAGHFPSVPKVGARPPRPAAWHGSACPRFSAPWLRSAPRCWPPSSSRKVARKCDVSTCPKASTRTMPPRKRSTVGGGGPGGERRDRHPGEGAAEPLSPHRPLRRSQVAERENWAGESGRTRERAPAQNGPHGRGGPRCAANAGAPRSCPVPLPLSAATAPYLRPSPRSSRSQEAPEDSSPQSPCHRFPRLFRVELSPGLPALWCG